MSIKRVIFNQDIGIHNIAYSKSPKKKTKDMIDYENGINALNHVYIENDDKEDLFRSKLTQSDIEFELRQKNKKKHIIITENWLPPSKIIIDASQPHIRYLDKNESSNQNENKDDNLLSDHKILNKSSNQSNIKSANQEIMPISNSNYIKDTDKKPKRRPIPMKKNSNTQMNGEQLSPKIKYRLAPPVSN